MTEKEMVKKILNWYEKNGRDFPWRETARTPYEILIGEVMLQKTRAESIVDCYIEFLEMYPSPKELAKTEKTEIKSIIEPLGLQKRRAKTLKEIAKFFIENDLPKDKEKIENISGIGKYMKNAFLSIAYNDSKPVVDVNVKRIFHRYFSLDVKNDLRRNPELWEFAEKLMGNHNPRKFNFALIDFGALVCKKSNPVCGMCPVKDDCDYDSKNLDD